MKRHPLILAGIFILGAGAFASTRLLLSTQAQAPSPGTTPAAVPAQPRQAETSPMEAGVKSATAEYVKAFNAHDAKAAATLWTAEGEYIGIDGVAVRGRAALEKSLADEFQANPKTNIQIQLVSVRPMGRQTALAEGVIHVKSPGESEPNETRYSALHVFEDGMWKAASVREWLADPDQNASMKLLDWLVGAWTAKGHGGTISIEYAWNESKTFLMGKYSIDKEGKTTSSGMEILARNPKGGLRSWTFDSSGTFSNAQWQRDGNRWMDESVGTLPDGTEVSSNNLLIPLGKDAFCWQTTDRSADGVPLSLLPPIKVTRVKAAK